MHFTLAAVALLQAGNAVFAAPAASTVFLPVSGRTIAFATRAGQAGEVSMPPAEHRRSDDDSGVVTYKSHNVCWPKGTYPGQFIDWKHYKANGANLGSWLWKEKSHDSPLWAAQDAQAAATSDEWSLCEALGDRCGPVLEERMKTFINEATIDKLASAGINTIRIPTPYHAWIKVPGTPLYKGSQVEHLRRIANYAIDKYQMHVIVGLHSLPGGVNTLDIGEAFGHDGWFFNQTNLDYSLKAFSLMLDFVKNSGRVNSFSLSPINEASDNFYAGFGTASGLTQRGANWILTYVDACLAMINEVDSRIPLILQDSFKSVGYWEPLFEASQNIVMSPHVYYFSLDEYAGFANYSMCGTAKWIGTYTKFPVMIGEWSLEVRYNNTLAGRRQVFDTQKFTFQKYANGATFWTAVSYGDRPVSGEGELSDYWSYTKLIDAGIATKNIVESQC